MNLATDNRSRVKLILAAVIALCMIVYALFAFVVVPTRAKRAETIEQIEGLEEDIEKAWTAIKRVAASRQANCETLAAVMEEAEGKCYVLRPRLGNYLLPASEVIHACAGACGVEIKTIAEGSLSVVPQTTTRKTANAFRSYTVRVSVECSYDELVRLLKCLEESNPYLCVCALNITGQGGNPENHAIGFDLQWPTWADLGVPEKIKEELAKDRNTSDDTDKGAKS